MKKRIGCYHAHHTNIEHVEKACGAFDVELVHFVDPGLDRIKNDADFGPALITRKINETLAWISKCHVDAVLVTCTWFTAHLQEEEASCKIPVVKIDTPLFHAICENTQPHILAFTNPATVEGTMNQLRSFAERNGKTVHVEPVLLVNTFELLMQGKKEAYIERVAAALCQLAAAHPEKRISAAQLSMVPAAAMAEDATGRVIGNQGRFLAGYLQRLLEGKRV
jgi:hypothetical protein